MTSSQDPDQIRAEIERTQAALSYDVDSLSEKVTPGRIVERRVDRARGTASRWKENVMGSDTRPYVGTHNGTGGATSHAGGRTHDAASAVSGQAHRVASSVSDGASSAGSTVADAATGVGRTVHDAPQAARRQAAGNPLAAGLIAFGAGWLISSLLPASQREQRLTGQAKDQVAQHTQPVVDAAKQVATEMRDDLRQPVQDAVGQVRSTATDAGHTVVDEGRSAAGQVQERAEQAPDHVRGVT